MFGFISSHSELERLQPLFSSGIPEGIEKKTHLITTTSSEASFLYFASYLSFLWRTNRLKNVIKVWLKLNSKELFRSWSR